MSSSPPNPFFHAEGGSSSPLWFLLGFVMAVPVAVLWWLVGRQNKPASGQRQTTALVKTGAAPLPAPDDLTRISGIGPKLNALLNEHGIRTYAQLAATPVARLNTLLEEAGLYMADPSGWPDQARALRR